MEPTRELIDELYRERVLRARRTPIEEEILSSATLFDEACQRMEAGIRSLHPEATNWCERHGIRALLEEIRCSIPPT